METLTASKDYADNLLEWLSYLDKEIGIIPIFTASNRYPDEVSNFDKLLETVRSHDTQLTITFLTRLGIPENQVVLTTRHSSKGLEFDIVILLGMEKDSFPSFYDNTPRKLAEARRLCFVSVSRARKACILIRSKFCKINTENGSVKNLLHFGLHCKSFKIVRIINKVLD